MQTTDRRDPLPLFDPSVSAARLRQLPGASTHRVPALELLNRLGEAPDRFHLIEAGAVSLSWVSRSGRRAVVAILGRGGAFGLEEHRPDAPSPGRPLHLEARALRPSVVLSLPLPSLFGALSLSPEVGGWLVGVVARGQERLQRALVLALTEDVAGRVLGVLEEMGREHGRPSPGGTRLELPVTQELLASMVGATRESVNRSLRDLTARGLVHRSGRTYQLSRRQAGAEGSS